MMAFCISCFVDFPFDPPPCSKNRHCSPVSPVSVLRATQRHLPPNFFVYAFAAGFLAPALGLGAAGLAGASALALTGVADAGVVFGDYVPILLYLAFAEGTLTGMLVTLLVVYRPQWVATFDDARYLDRR